MPFTIPNSADAAFAGQASPDAGDIAVMNAAHALTGVVSGCTATVTGSDMNVTIATGVVMVDGKEATVAGGSVTISAAHGSLARYDLITVNSSGTKAATAGTAASNPVFPAIPANSVVLYAVYVPAADTTIQSNQLTDKRVVIRRDDDFLAYIHF